MKAVVSRVTAVVALALTTGVLGVHAGKRQQSNPRPGDPPAGTGLIVGRVVDATSGTPIAGAAVTITGGAAIPGAPVEMLVGAAPPVAPGATAPRQVMADAEGRFMFRDLARGRYSIRTTATGYLGGAFGQNRWSGLSQQVELATDNEKLGGVLIKMWKTAALSGTVLDEAGEPVVGQRVQSIRRVMVSGRQRFSLGTGATTDDRGFYRIAGLSPGDYVLGIVTTVSTMPVQTGDAYMQSMMAGGSSTNSEVYRQLTSSSAPFPSGGGFRVGDLILQTTGGRGGMSSPLPPPTDDGRVFVYPSVFYPRAGVLSEATVLTLGSGDDRRGLDLHLTLTPAVRVSGTVLGPEGPVAYMGVRLVPAGADEFTFESEIEAASTATAPGGAFTFLGVTPGQYALKVVRIPRDITREFATTMSVEVSGPGGMIMGMSSGGPTTGPVTLPTEPTLWATQSLAIGNSDITGLRLQLQPGARVSGRFEFDGAKDKPGAAQLQGARVSITPTQSRLVTQTTAVRVEGDGRFNSGGYVPGRYAVTATIPSTPGGATGWTFKSATLGARNVSDEGLDLAAEDISGLVITFTDRTSEISGTVVDSRNQLDKSADVLIFPADSQAWKQGFYNSRRLRSVRVSSAGTYVLSAVPGGEYFLVAVNTESLADWQDPKVLEKLTALATRVTIADGDKKVQSLTTQVVR